MQYDNIFSYLSILLLPIGAFGQINNTQAEQQKELAYDFMDSVLTANYKDKYIIDWHNFQEKEDGITNSFQIHDRFQAPVSIYYRLKCTPEMFFDQVVFEERIEKKRAQIELRISQSKSTETILRPLFKGALVLSSSVEAINGVGTQLLDVFTNTPFELEADFYAKLNDLCTEICIPYKPHKVVFQIYFQKPETIAPDSLDRFTMLETEKIQHFSEEFMILEYGSQGAEYHLQKEQYKSPLSKEELNELKKVIDEWKLANSYENWTTHVEYTLYESLDSNFRLKKFRLYGPSGKELKIVTIDLKTFEIILSD